jgi:transcriptional antiterminator RfaH
LRSPPDKPKAPEPGSYPLEPEAAKKARKTPAKAPVRGGSSTPAAKTHGRGRLARHSAKGKGVKDPQKRKAGGTRRKAPKPPAERWGLVRVKVGAERYAKMHIERQGMRAFYPRIAERPGKLQAMFPGYVFVVIETRWYFLKSTYGVVSVLTTGGEPSRVPPRLIRQLIRDQGQQGYIETRPEPPKRRALKAGDPVIMTDGTFKSLKAEYISGRPGDRVRVLLEFMGKAQRVDLPAESVAFDHDAPSNPGPIKAKPGAVARKQSAKPALPLDPKKA